MEPTRLPTLSRHAIAVAAITLSTYGLYGCGSQPSSASAVASIPATATQNGPASSSSASAGSNGTAQSGNDGGTGRPQMRLDDTPARRAALINAWDQCLFSHGATKEGVKRGPTTEIVVAEPIPAKASAACENLLPEPPPELDAATNPNFHEQVLKYVNCMQDHGLWVQLVNNYDIDWTFAPGHPVPSNQDQIEQACELQAFGNK